MSLTLSCLFLFNLSNLNALEVFASISLVVVAVVVVIARTTISTAVLELLVLLLLVMLPARDESILFFILLSTIISCSFRCARAISSWIFLISILPRLIFAIPGL